REWQILRIAFLPGDVGIAQLRRSLARAAEKLRREVQSCNGGAARTRHQRRVACPARNVEDTFAGTDARAPDDMVGNRLNAPGDLVVVARGPNHAMPLFQLNEV